MRSQRLVAWLSICLQGWALWRLSGSVTFPVLVSGVALFGVVTPRRFDVDRATAFRMTALGALLFILKFMLAPHDFPYRNLFISTQLAHAAAEYFMALQAAQFFVRREGDRLPGSLPALGAVALICMADVNVGVRLRASFQLVVLAFTALSAAYLTASRRLRPLDGPKTSLSRNLVAAAVLVLVLLFGFGSSVGLVRYERDIEQWISRVMAPSRPTRLGASSTEARLDSVSREKARNADEVALRIQTDAPPGYLRGRVFDTYADGSWRTIVGSRVLEPTNRYPPGMPPPLDGRNVFRIGEPDSTTWRRIEVWPQNSAGDVLFAPLGVSHAAAATPTVTVNPYGAVSSRDLLPGHPYALLLSQPGTGPPLDAESHRRLQAVPEGLDPRVRELADELFQGKQEVREKVEAVERFFRENYGYVLGIDVPRNVEPVEWFLLERPDAHCEFFAAGAAVLLRLGGVPCRYVTGYVPTEQNPYGRYWVARNRDAHAWVEACDESGRWLVVEATPPSGVPQPRNVSHLSSFLDAIANRLQEFRIRLAQGGLPWLWGAFVSWLASPTGRATMAILLCGVLVFVVWRHRRKKRKPATVLSPAVRKMRRLLIRADRLAARHSFVRRKGETLHAFARRLVASGSAEVRLLAGWYLAYAGCRYGRPMDDASLSALDERLRDLRRGSARTDGQRESSGSEPRSESTGTGIR